MSKLETNQVDPASGTTLTLGTSGDTVIVPTGVGLTATDEVKSNKLSPATGTALQIGDSGDTITIPSGATITNNGTQTGFGGTNTPNFHAYVGSNVSLANTTTFTVPMNSERWDTAGAFNTSDYSFTVPSGQGGKYNMTFKYLLSGSFTCRIVGYFVRNGSDYAGMQMQHNSTDTCFIINANLNLSASDVIRVSAYQDSGSSRTLLGGTTFSEFSGFKIIE